MYPFSKGDVKQTTLGDALHSTMNLLVEQTRADAQYLTKAYFGCIAALLVMLSLVSYKTLV